MLFVVNAVRQKVIAANEQKICQLGNLMKRLKSLQLNLINVKRWTLNCCFIQKLKVYFKFLNFTVHLLK